MMFMNVGGLLTSNHHPKNQEICSLVCKNEADILGLVEVNTNGSEVPYHHQLQERTIPWWESKHVTLAHSCNYISTCQHHWGEVALFSINKIAHQVFESGYDAYGLGRLTWIRYKEKMRYSCKWWLHTTPGALMV